MKKIALIMAMGLGYSTASSAATDDSQKLQTLINSACLGNQVLENDSDGVYTISNTVNITCSLDASGVSIEALGDLNNSSVMVVVDQNTSSGVLKLPNVRNPFQFNKGRFKGIGIKIIGLKSAKIEIGTITNFNVGLSLNSYANSIMNKVFYIRHLQNNQINLSLDNIYGRGITGNKFIGGRYSHWSLSNDIDKTYVTKHVQIRYANSNSWVGSSLETNGASDFPLDIIGDDNYFLNVRWEGASKLANNGYPLQDIGGFKAVGNNNKVVCGRYWTDIESKLISGASDLTVTCQ